MTTDKANTRFCPECFQVFPAEAQHCPEHGVELADLPTEASLVGGTLDQKYEIVKKIGRGGMGTVYHARQKFIGREIAIKVLRPEFAQDVQAIQRFFAEVRAACKLRSRHCVIVHDFGLSQEGHLYFSMELLHGRPLTRLLKEGPLESDRAMAIAIDVCHAIEEAHGLGIVHRDLKPDNVMLVRDEHGSLAKVLDFGIAKLLTEEDGASLTQTGMVCGTPEYMSPEQARGDALGFASDLYSLGIILYEMLAGLPPFQAPSPLPLLMKHVNEAPRSIRVVSPDIEVPVELERYLLQMLAKDPADRPESAAAVRLTLEQMLVDRGKHKTTSLPELVSSSRGVRSVTVPFGGVSNLAMRDTDSIAATRRDAPDVPHATREEEWPKTESPPEQSFDTAAFSEDHEPGANTRAMVRSIDGRKRRMHFAVGAIVAVSILVGVALLSGLWDPGVTSTETAEDASPAEAGEPGPHSANPGTGEDAGEGAAATSSPDIQSLAEASNLAPGTEATPGETISAPPPLPLPAGIGSPLADQKAQPLLDPETPPPEVTGDETDEVTVPKEPIDTHHVESETAASMLETGLRYKIQRKYDLAIQEFETAKKHGGDPQELDKLISECQRQRDGAQ